jgi:thioredoxin-like negative regulator of GroEL
MIETLIEAERALTHGLVDQAERLYRQVAANDPRSSIAVMGLARVALERGDDRTAYLHARVALAIDADNPAAQHLVMRLAEVMTARGEALPDISEMPAVVERPHPPVPDRTAAAAATATATNDEPGVTPAAPPGPSPRPARTRSHGLLGRLLRRKPRPR